MENYLQIIFIKHQIIQYPTPYSLQYIGSILILLDYCPTLVLFFLSDSILGKPYIVTIIS